MREAWVVLAARAMLAAAGSVANAAVPKALEPLRFLLGDWQADGGAKPGDPSGGFTSPPASRTASSFAPTTPSTPRPPASRPPDTTT